MKESDNKIRLAFLKIKQDINFLNSEILDLKISIDELKSLLNNSQKNLTDNSTIQQINSTEPATSTHSSTVQQGIEWFKPLNLAISIGNKGVSTDRQTDRQTDNSTHILTKKTEKSIESDIKEASEILDSLDALKKEIRIKFKHLTTQEMSVFSTIYQLEEEQHSEITYKTLSKHLKLSESSIRDYVQRIINKGIPIKKKKVDNKKILVSISPELKKVASLPTIIRLREL